MYEGRYEKSWSHLEKVYERVQVSLVPLAFAQTSPLNTLACAPSGARGDMFGTSLHQIPFSVFASSKGPGLEVIKLVFILRLKIKRNDWLLADTCPQTVNHFALF